MPNLKLKQDFKGILVLYLLDANVLIDANRDYYAIDRVPEFWEWLEHQGSRGAIKIPIEVYEETRQGKDNLANWAKTQEVKAALLLDEDVEVELVARVVGDGYASNLTDDEIERLGRDPFLVAYALADPGDRCVVTTEVSKPRRIRANRHVPDVCRTLGIRSCDTFAMARELDFRTSWRSS